jgi:hypothetical protein
MRRRTRNVVLAVLAILGLLLALGAVPGLLRSGDPYYLTATPQEGSGPGENLTAINVTGMSEARYPYATAALAAATDGPGRAEAYWRGPIGIKEAFTHSPFDELTALRQQNATAATEAGVYVYDERGLYLLSIQQ